MKKPEDMKLVKLLKKIQMSKNNNITFDLETLGVTYNAPIVQIGAVKFKDSGEIIDTFLRTIDIPSLHPYNFQCDDSTVEFWASQPQETFDSVFNLADEHLVPIEIALQDFMDWVKEPLKFYYWSHATFDPPILANSMSKVKVQGYLPFKYHRDIRTLTHLSGGVDIERHGFHHNALDDSIYQAEYISKCLQKNKNG